MKPSHRRGSHGQKAAKRVVDAAKANPHTLCWRCGRTLEQHPPHKSGRPAFWTAGHTVDTSSTCPLLPEASVCNFSAGGRMQRAHGLDSTRSW
jgi:hypothetical protein